MQRQTKRFILLTTVSGIAVVGFFFKSRFFSRILEQTTRDEVLFHADTTEKIVALTIDDGPHPGLTPAILDILATHQVPATFFVIGDHVNGNEQLLERMVAEGHELGNHMMDDSRSILLDTIEFKQQLATAHDLLSAYGPVHWFRPGSGLYNGEMLEAIRPYGYRTVIGSVYPYDAHIHSPEFTSSYVISNAQPGAIIIMHDGYESRFATATALERIIPSLQKRGYRFVTLSDMAARASNGTLSYLDAPIP
jgi:peptidoglycan/xylan/chitin deacetylase (PgdA/CDA1 family)